MGNIKLEGTLSDHDVIIGSNIILTCTGVATPSTSCTTIWHKNSKRLAEEKETGRIKWIQGERISADRCSVPKLMIKNFNVHDAGKYKCLAIDVLPSPDQTESQQTSIDIYAGKSVMHLSWDFASRLYLVLFYL
jgi:hypothetical protein